jgi:5-methyltetrahydropteroyltriglutamate--homocysteine methyltransferase
MELISLLYGIYPRSENLRKAYGKWEKGQMNADEISKKIEEESFVYYDLVKEASLNYFTDPLFNWYDILRPIALSIEGITLGPLTRYKTTNTFYREPEIERIGKLGEMNSFREVEENPPFPVYHELESESYLHFLPGINSFLTMSRVMGEVSGVKNQLKERYLEIIKNLRIKKLLIYEPFESKDFSVYSDINDATTTFLVISGDAGNFDTIGGKKFFSIIGNNPYAYARYCEVPGVKIIDALSTKISGEVVQKMRPFSNEFDRLIVANTESFDFLPRVIADKKIFSFKGGE